MENLKTKLCNDLIKSGLVKKGDVINHSYNWGGTDRLQVFILQEVEYSLLLQQDLTH